MKKRNRTIGRTLAGIAMTILGIAFIYLFATWHDWCPSNGLGFAIVVPLFVGGPCLLLDGIYEISPVFWTSLKYALITYFMVEEDIPLYEKEVVYPELRELKSKYLW